MGHSGAGAFLPAIAGRLEGRTATLLFVDAVLPPPSGVHKTPPRLRALLDEQTIDGHLRRWLEWWPSEVVNELVPDLDERAALLADMPSLPRSFYDESVPVPDGWTERRCAYLKLSDAYDAEFAEAGRRGWRRAQLEADHLAIRTQPDRVVEALASLLDAAQWNRVRALAVVVAQARSHEMLPITPRAAVTSGGVGWCVVDCDRAAGGDLGLVE